MHTAAELPLDLIGHGHVLLREIDDRAVSELAKSIHANGLLQPILVRPTGSSYEVVFGHHRLEACRRLGWKSIPAVVGKMSSDESFLTNIVENLQRNAEINPLVEAKGYIALIDHGWTINKIAVRIGRSDSYVSDRIGLVRRLHPEVAKRVNRNGHLKPSHVELLSRIRSKSYQLELSDLVERKHLSVRKLEKMISGGQPFREKVEGNGDWLYVHLPDEVVEQMELEAGDSVYMYFESRKRIAIERSIVQEPWPTSRVSRPTKKSCVTPVCA